MEVIKAIIQLILGLSIILTILVGPIYVLKSISCKRRAVGFIDQKYGIIEGCMVAIHTPHGVSWIPLRNVRVEVY